MCSHLPAKKLGFYFKVLDLFFNEYFDFLKKGIITCLLEIQNSNLENYEIVTNFQLRWAMVL